MKNALLIFFSLSCYLLNAQKVIKETYFDPEGKANINNLREVQIDKAKNEMKLYFLTKNTTKKIKAEILTFDLNFNFINAENIEEDYEIIKEKYKMRFSLNFCPESKEPLLTVEPNMFSGQVVFKKGYIERYYNWNTGLCDDKFNVEEKVKPKGDDGERIKLVNYWTNNTIESYIRSVSANGYNARQAVGAVRMNQLLYGVGKKVMTGTEGDLVFLGMVSDGARDVNKGKNYTFQKFSVASLQKTHEIPLTFDVMAAPMFHKILPNGNIAYIFHSADNQIEFIEVDFDGKTQRRFKTAAPTDGIWCIDDIAQDGDNLIVAGVVSKASITKGIGSFVYTPHANPSYLATHAMNPRGFQVMKISKDKIDWVAFTKSDQFKPTFAKIPEDKKGKPYSGGQLIIGDIYQANSGDILITGQKKGNKGNMGEMVCFYFNSKGELQSNFATIMRDKNKYNKFKSSTHSLLNSPSSQDVYWIIYEVAGVHKWSGRTLYYPRICRIKQGGKSADAFVEIGNRKAYLDNSFPINYVDDKTFIFLGSNRNGKTLWFSKVEFE
jgi:hypothetical protein